MSINAATGEITSRDKDGKATVGHLDLAPDLANGLPLILLLNLDPSAPPTKLSMVAPTAKPRLAHLLLAGEGKIRSPSAASVARPRTSASRSN